MFTTAKVENFLQSCKFTGDAEKPELQIAFYVTPLTYDLLYEIDDRVAKQLFRREGEDHLPVAELDDVTLKIGELGIHNIEWFPHPEMDGSGVMTPNCKVTKVEASKLFADKTDWSLIWHVQVPLNSLSLDLASQYYRSKTFLTLERCQEELFEEEKKEESAPA